MNTTKIIFVRHAKAQYGEDDRTRPLTEEGLRNRAIVVETLKGRQIDSFLSSPYKRSKDTIQTAADFFGMQIETDERFRERKVGTWEIGWLEKDGLTLLVPKKEESALLPYSLGTWRLSKRCWLIMREKLL